jgi:hypothetical protein
LKIEIVIQIEKGVNRSYHLDVIKRKEKNMNRKVEKILDTLSINKWVEINFEDLKKDDIFRMFEVTGELVLRENKESIFIATGDAYFNDILGVYTIDIAD